MKPTFRDEDFHMVAQVQWEDDVIWNGDESRNKVIQSQKHKALAAGWIPSSSIRTAVQFQQHGNGIFKHP